MCSWLKSCCLVSAAYTCRRLRVFRLGQDASWLQQAYLGMKSPSTPTAVIPEQNLTLILLI